MESSAIKCAECGRDLEEERNSETRLPCPDCGSLKRHFFETIELKTVTSCSVSSKTIDINGFVKQEERCKDDISVKSGRNVKTTISIDRRDPNITKKYHKVEEIDEHGIFYKTIHEHTDISDAKHRPKK